MSNLLTMKEVCIRTSLSRAEIWRKVDRKVFPAPCTLGERKCNKLGRPTGRIAWVEEEVEAWIAERLKVGRIVRL